MKKVNKHNNELASEEFVPSLSDLYQKRYSSLLESLKSSLPTNYIYVLEKEMASVSESDMESIEDVEYLKYLATINVLKDLVQQGWIFDIKDGKLYLRLDSMIQDSKEYIRYRLSAERNAQFKVPSIKGFIKSLEKERLYNGKSVSVKNLIGQADLIREAIKNGETITKPYINLSQKQKMSSLG